MFIPRFDLQLIATIEYRLMKKYEQKKIHRLGHFALILLSGEVLYLPGPLYRKCFYELERAKCQGFPLH